MNYIYDGSFYGFLTAIFIAYKDLEGVQITSNSHKLNFLDKQIRVEVDRVLANRVKTGIIANFSTSFFREITVAFRSESQEKETIIARTLKGMYREGFSYLNSANPDPVAFRGLVKRVYGENHTYKGLLRFREVEGGVLYGQMRPKNDILDLLTPHFVRRMPREKFIIHDVGRKIFSVYEDGLVDYFEDEDLDLKDSKEEEFFKRAWIKFYDSVAIEERKNKKLMISNMPKYHWEFLPERVRKN